MNIVALLRSVWSSGQPLVAVSLLVGASVEASNQGTELVPSIFTRIEAVDSWHMRLVIVNKGEEQIAIRTNFTGIDAMRFLGFPDAGSFQLRDMNGRILALKEIQIPTSGGWFHPLFLNSVINQPVFARKGETPDPTRDLSVITIDAGETKAVTFDCKRVLHFVKSEAKRVNANAYRVKIDLKVAKDGQPSPIGVIGDWINLPSDW